MDHIESNKHDASFIHRLTMFPKLIHAEDKSAVHFIGDAMALCLKTIPFQPTNCL